MNVLKILLKLVLYPVSLGTLLIGLMWVTKFIKAIGYEYNDQGNYFDGVINHHEQYIPLFFIFAVVFIGASILSCWIAQRLKTN